MPANTVVRARIDERVKKEAEAVLASIGLTVSDAFRLLMIRVAAEKALPFEPLIPNEETIQAIKAARRGELVKWNDCRDCHVRPDLILIYRKPDADHLELVRLGSHSEIGF